jgi:two-component system, cell cycle sensor histidine kinase and response regulator CckA
MGSKMVMEYSSNSTLWKILMVDDDEDDYLLVREMLADTRKGKSILEWACTFEAGRQALHNSQFDAVLIDYDLGGHNGLDLIREANSNGYPGAFILFTGRGSHEVDIEAMQVGASMYLTKSETSALMLERGIRYAIERKQ